MQEVNQSMNAPKIAQEFLRGFVETAGTKVVIRKDNHAAQVAYRLEQAGICCSWAWIPLKVGYGIYDEGLAVFSLKRPIMETDAFTISRCDEYENWKRRRVLGVRVDGYNDWFYTVHMGWWNDEEEPFSYHWEQFEDQIAKKKVSSVVWVMGDFNNPAEVSGQGYDHIAEHEWWDTYSMAEIRDNGVTVNEKIDGWKEQVDPSIDVSEGMRIDHIWCSHRIPISRSQVVLNGENGPKVSDHFGVMIENCI